MEEHRYEFDLKFIRGLVLARDKGVCAHCGTDCLDEYSRLGKLAPHWSGHFEEYRAALKDWRISYLRDLWEADHIVPRCQGGTNRLENLQTLCIRCHKDKTRQMRRPRRKPVAARAYEN